MLSARAFMCFGGRSTSYRLKLRVEIPGYAPYDVNGATVAVQADSADLQKVRIDSGQPAPARVGWSGPPLNAQQSPPGTPMSPGLRLYIRVLWIIVGVGCIAAIAAAVIALAVLR